MVLYECKLTFHKKTKPEEDVLFCSKDFPSIRSGCLLEIFHSENEKHHLIKIESINPSFQQKDTISLDLHLANSLKLNQIKILKFRIVDENLITLDVLDLIVKDQYLSRSDMYRFTNSIRNSILQMGKKLEFGPYRGTVGEMWCKGHRNHCGYFGANTRVVFRSATAVVHIFIQMSAEMWEFDYFGELYFDKAINFISDLFNKWNDNNCGHDVTIVLFSRLFYKDLSEVRVSENARRNIKIDHSGRFYEDFYIVVVQNERYVTGEWRKVIKTLKFRFNNYKSELEEFQQKHFESHMDSESYLSTAEDANFLETLNITLNLYENYYIDRNFERTGKVCVVITAGSGVYNVDQIYTNLTKRRICDLGVGMDLVCIGEQPLHAVPLFIFHQKNVSNVTDKHYYIPYWINHSFYRSVNELQAIQMGKFIPRIRVRFEKTSGVDRPYKVADPHKPESTVLTNSLNVISNATKYNITIRKASTPDIINENPTYMISTSNNCDRGTHLLGNYNGRNSKDDCYMHSMKTNKKEVHTKALFNPFAPNRFNVRTTANSRRWSHVFPIDKNNKPIQLHHQLAINSPHLYGFERKKTKNMVDAWKNYFSLYNSVKSHKSNESLDISSSPVTRDTVISPKSTYRESDESEITNERIGFPISTDKASEDSMILSPLPNSFQGASSQKSFPQISSMKSSINRKVHTLFTEGEQKWSWDQPKEDESPINHMGVDWKSLTLPAMLPITSDYYPSPKLLEDEFMESNYQLMADNLENTEDSSQHHRKPLGINDVFQELIYQRLNQGFQLITSPPTITNSNGSHLKDVNKKAHSQPNNGNVAYSFGLGCIYHSIQLKQEFIHVTQYSPRYTNNVDDIKYNYCLKMPDSKEYMMSKTKFSTQMLEKFNWNYHDHYILNYGGNCSNDLEENGSRYKLIPSLKYWRSRFYLLPMHSATKTIIDTDKNIKIRCDIYDEKSVVEQNSLIEEFFKFLEVINKIKRRVPNSKQKKSMPQFDNSTLMNNSNIIKVKSVSSNLLDLKTSTIQSACIAGVNPISSIRHPSQRHSTTNEPIFYNLLCEQTNNSSNPVTPIEKYPRQFTFDSIDNSVKGSNENDHIKLTDTSPILKILEEMTSAQNGLTFLPSNEFPNEYTFTSYEAVNWCIRKIDKINDVKAAVIYLQKLVNLKYIFHASECPSHKFIYGFVFYYFNTSLKVFNSSSLDMRNISTANSSSSSLTNLTTEETEKSLKVKKSNIEWVEVYLSSIEMDGKPERNWISEYLERPSTVGHINGETNRPFNSAHNIIPFMKKIAERYFTNCLTSRNSQDFIGNSHDPGMLCETNGVVYKKVVLDIDNDRNDRSEWGVFQYQANYHPTVAFELMFQWLVITGGKLSEKISQWSRKTSILQLVPVPCDPFAFPSSINSDPLRGPIFVPLNIVSLIDDLDNCNPSLAPSIRDIIDHLFGDFPGIERLFRLLLFQEAILKRFGFIRESCVNYCSKEYMQQLQWDKGDRPLRGGSAEFLHSFQNVSGTSLKWSYIHYSGGMFAMIPSYGDRYRDIDGEILLPVRLEDMRHDHRSPINRPQGLEDESEAWEAPEIGFQWSWNKMLTRKWTTTAMIIDEQFQDRMLADFRDFCSNVDDRLRQFYRDARTIVNRYSRDTGSTE